MDYGKEYLPFFKGPQDNFLYWSARIKALLKSKKVWSVVRDPTAPASSSSEVQDNSNEVQDNTTTTATATPDASAAAAATLLAEQEKKDVACSIILRSLGPVPFAAVMRYQEEPRTMWTLLQARYASDTTFSKASIHTELARMKYQGQTMDVYISKWEQLSAQLDVMKSSLDEGLLITMFFESFGNRRTSDYGSAISAMLTKDSLHWPQVTARMMQEYKSIATIEDGAGGRTDSAYVAKMKCYYCKKVGHKKADCWKRKKDLREAEDNSKKKIKETALMCHVGDNMRKAQRALLDSGASAHMMKGKQWMERGVKAVDKVITTASNDTLTAKSEGTANIRFDPDGPIVRLNRALHVPGISDNLLSVSALCNDGYTVSFAGEGCTVRRSTNVVARGRREGGTYVFDIRHASNTAKVARSSEDTTVKIVR